MSHTLYRMFAADGSLLYVGITNNPIFRFREHRTAKEWWTEVASISLTHYESREKLAAAERQAVKAECPLWNVVRFKGPEPRARRTPPMVSLWAARQSLQITPQFIHERIGGRFSIAQIEDFERGLICPPDLPRLYEAALGLPAGSITTEYTPRATPAASEVA